MDRDAALYSSSGTKAPEDRESCRENGAIGAISVNNAIAVRDVTRSDGFCMFPLLFGGGTCHVSEVSGVSMVALPRGVNLGPCAQFGESRSGSPTLLGIVNWAGDTPAVSGPGVLGTSRRGRQGRVGHGEGLSVVGVPASQHSQVIAV